MQKIIAESSTEHLISEQYANLNREMHQTMPHYGARGDRHKETVMKISSSAESTDILDYGCGKGGLAASLPFQIKQYDPGIEKFSALPSPADIVVCTDVLEHVERARIGDVLAHIASLTKKICYLVISTREAAKKLPDGRNAHLIVYPSNWWLHNLINEFDIISFYKSSDSEMTVYAKPLEKRGKQC